MASSATKHSLDFTNVKEGGNFSKKHMPPGDYLAKITKVEDAKPKDKTDKTPMWLFTIQLKSTPSATYPYYCKLQENQLWKVRNLLVAAGINVPKKKVGVDPTRLVGKVVAVSLDDTEYNGKDQSEIGSVFSPSDLDATVDAEDDDDDVDDVDEDDEDDAPKKSKKSKAAEPDEDEDDDDDDEPAPPKKKKAKVEEPEDDDDDEDSDDDEPEPPKKLTKKERAAARRAKKKAEAEAAESDDDDDDDDDEDEEPAPKKKKAKKPADDEDDDDEIDIEDLD